MVDFNNDVTIATPAANVVKILLLQARANVLEALEFYNKKDCDGVQASQGTVKSRLGTWFLEHQAYLKRTMNKDDYDIFEKRCFDQLFFNAEELSKKELLEMVTELNDIMDKLQITKVDTKIQYDRTDIEKDNKMNELG
jgi:hypothetical protein